MSATFDTIRVTNAITVPENGVSVQTRSTILKQDPNMPFAIDLTRLRVWDAFATNLPGTPATDDLGLEGGTFGTSPPMVTAGDLKAAGATTRYARFQVQLPECYEDGETVTLSFHAGMTTTIADTSCTIDVECYKIDKEGGIGSDLCSTGATTINSLTFGPKKFLITSTALVAGDVLDVRVAIACTDAATVTAVTPKIAAIDLLCDIKG